MNKRLLSMGLCLLIVGCGDSGGNDAAQDEAANAFRAEGVSVAASSELLEKLSETTAEVPGIAGALILKLSSFESDNDVCAVDQTGTMIIPYTVKTSFDPPAAKVGTLDHRLAVTGTVVRKGESCVLVATEVNDQGSAPASEPPPRQVPAQKTGSGKRASPPATTRGPSVDSAPPDRSDLPPLAPVVTTTFRPSLPNPPPH